MRDHAQHSDVEAKLAPRSLHDAPWVAPSATFARDAQRLVGRAQLALAALVPDPESNVGTATRSRAWPVSWIPRLGHVSDAARGQEARPWTAGNKRGPSSWWAKCTR